MAGCYPFLSTTALHHTGSLSANSNENLLSNHDDHLVQLQIMLQFHLLEFHDKIILLRRVCNIIDSYHIVFQELYETYQRETFHEK